MNVPFGRRVVMIALERQPRRWRNTSIWSPLIIRQAWLADGAAVSVAGKGRAEGEDSSTFSCCSYHVSCDGGPAD